MEINFFVGYKLGNIYLSRQNYPVSRIFSELEYILKACADNFN
jgi:hypothetical protein